MVEDEESKNAETKGGYAKEMSAEYQKKTRGFIGRNFKDNGYCNMHCSNTRKKSTFNFEKRNVGEHAKWFSYC